MNKILISGAAGFIGYSLVKQLIKTGEYQIVGLDNINNYYDVTLKYGRLQDLGIEQSVMNENELITSNTASSFRFIKLDLQDREQLNELMDTEGFDIVCNLAAQAGVRYSIDHPYAYLESNLVGFMNILEASRQHKIKHYIYASSSSVYGTNNEVPYSESDQVDQPLSLYAATKKSNELMAHSYSKLYSMRTTGIRFFTVYGPWGRPDMAPYLFMDAIVNCKPIKVFNHGNLERDFTYVDDIVNGIVLVINSKISQNEIPYQIYNLGNSMPVKLMDFISSIEYITGKLALKEFAQMQPGDVYKTYANMKKFEEHFGYKPKVNINVGLSKMYEWYKTYFKS
ncbi:MAG: GDP-mannose 4,6-dehydratase [Paludibacter sp.]|jgi:UDP-glucuronate 4-epimerase|nr:GDP-mannose 4,6-dehydratase [Paludibacter sp.]